MKNRENKDRKKLVVLSGAGVSAESGIPTFRGSDGLWEGHDITEVASPEGWQKDPELVLDFYNKRRAAIINAQPNEAHLIIAQLEAYYDVTVVTQNIDDLHERAGSSHVMHLHGEIKKVRSTKDPNLIYDWDKEDLAYGELCELGSQLRPHIVWFGEQVPMIEPAYRLVQEADLLIVIGTSLQVYPAASLVNGIQKGNPIYVVDPGTPSYPFESDVIAIQKNAVEGMQILRDELV